MKPGENQGNFQEKAMERVVNQCLQSISLVSELQKALQDELLINTKIRAQIQRDLNDLFNKLKAIEDDKTSPVEKLKDVVDRISKIQDELIKVTAKVNQIESHVKATISRVGTNPDSLLERLSKDLQRLKMSLETRERILEQLEQKKERQKDRGWETFSQLLPNLLTWIGLLIWWLIEHSKK
jgi:chromosome segregation ATPase